MPRHILLSLAAAVLLAAGAHAAPAPEAEPGPFHITNDAHRVVECNLLVDGATHTYLKVHPGRSYAANFRPHTLLQLACIRGQQDTFGPLKPGVDYRFVDRDANKVDVVAGAVE